MLRPAVSFLKSYQFQSQHIQLYCRYHQHLKLFVWDSLREMTDLRDKVVLVTGASGGIGLAIAETLANRRMNVIGCARNIAAIEEINKRLQKDSHPVHAIQCDLTKENEVLDLFHQIAQKHGKIDVLINNAGLNHAARAATASLIDGLFQSWKDMTDLNVLALTLCTREAVKLIESGGSNSGHIININSLAGHRVSNRPSSHFYTGTKHMVTALTKGLRISAQAKSIRVTSLSPGRTEVGMGETAKAAYKDVKVLETKDIADAVVYVLSAPAHVNIDELTITPLQQV